MKPKLIIFDCDGVLVDSEHLASKVLAEQLQSYGVDYTEQDCRRLFTGCALSSVKEAITQSHQIDLPANWIDDLRQKDRDVFEKELSPIAGVAETLDALADYRLCVASSGRMEKITHSLKLTGLYDLLSPHLFSAQMVEKGKPAPDLFIYAAQQMKVSPNDCLVIEDSRFGVQAAVAAGMPVFGFTGGSHCETGHGDDLLNQGAMAVFKHMPDLLERLEEYDGS